MLIDNKIYNQIASWQRSGERAINKGGNTEGLKVIDSVGDHVLGNGCAREDAQYVIGRIQGNVLAIREQVVILGGLG